MNFVRRYFWPLVAVFIVIGAVSLAFNVGAPAAVAGVVIGILLMFKAGQADPAPDLKGWTGGGGTGPGAEPSA